MYCQYPDEFKKDHPKLFKKYEQMKMEMKACHRCNIKDLKEKIEYWKNEYRMAEKAIESLEMK